MATTYTGNPANVSLTSKATITVKQDGDAVNAASDTVAEDAIADTLEWLAQQVMLNAALSINSVGLTPGANVNSVAAAHFANSVANAQVVACGATGLAVWSAYPAVNNWQTLAPPSGTPAMNGCASSPTASVFVGAINPTNPAIWTWAGPGNTLVAATNTLTAALNCVVWNSTLALWVAGGAGASGSILTSATAAGTGAWTTQTSTLGAIVNSIVVGPAGLMLAFHAGSNQAWTSANGTAWTSNNGPGNILSATYSPVSGNFVVVEGSTGKIWTSATGVNGSWTAVYTFPATITTGVLYQVGRLLVCLGAGAQFATSFDGGATWKARYNFFTGSSGSVPQMTFASTLDNGTVIGGIGSTTLFTTNSPYYLP